MERHATGHELEIINATIAQLVDSGFIPHMVRVTKLILDEDDKINIVRNISHDCSVHAFNDYHDRQVKIAKASGDLTRLRIAKENAEKFKKCLMGLIEESKKSDGDK